MPVGTPQIVKEDLKAGTWPATLLPVAKALRKGYIF